MTRITVTSPKYTMHATGLPSDEAMKLCRALAWHRYFSRCECENEVGYTCRLCDRESSAPYELEDLIEAYADWLFCMMVKKEEPKQ